MNFSQTAKRLLRTAAQVGVAEAVIRLLQAFHIVTWDEGQTAAALGVITMVVTLLHNATEDATGATILPK